MEAQIWDAFAESLATFAATFSPPLPVSYQGVHFNPPDDGAWLELAFFPNETETRGLANDCDFIHQGFAQVAVCTRKGEGITAGLTIAGQVLEHFAKGTGVGPALLERKPWVSAVVQMDDKSMFPVTIPYRARD